MVDAGIQTPAEEGRGVCREVGQMRPEDLACALWSYAQLGFTEALPLLEEGLRLASTWLSGCSVQAPHPLPLSASTSVKLHPSPEAPSPFSSLPAPETQCFGFVRDAKHCHVGPSSLLRCVCMARGMWWVFVYVCVCMCRGGVWTGGVWEGKTLLQEQQQQQG